MIYQIANLLMSYPAKAGYPALHSFSYDRENCDDWIIRFRG
jgi:hypothetical protein